MRGVKNFPTPAEAPGATSRVAGMRFANLGQRLRRGIGRQALDEVLSLVERSQNLILA